ncbi:MAG: chloride channel protein, partial [Deltaproteobacteria bacterium]
MDIRAMGRPLLLASLVGVIAGLGAIVFTTGVHLCDVFFLEHLGQYHPLPKGTNLSTAAIVDSLKTPHRW